MPSNIIRQIRRPSIRDVARAASVSTSTVSLVLNRHETVTPAMRRRVREAMTQLGYRPRAAGRPIVRGRGQTILLVYSQDSIHEGWLSRLAESWTDGVCMTLAANGVRLCSMTFGCVGSDCDTLKSIIACADVLHGVIVIGNVEKTGVLNVLLKQRVPVVVLNGRPEFGEYSHVSIDNYGSMLQSFDYLVGLGHRHIAYVGSPGSYVFVREREKGIADACTRHGIELVYNQPLDPVAHPEQVDAVCRGVLESGATAVCTGDYAAISCIRRWCEMGIDVPRDLSVLGYDDLGFRTHDDRRVTSIGYDKFRMGELAAEAMLEILQDNQMLRHRSARMVTRIVPGDTTRRLLEPERLTT